jgi:hypothetical protein
MARSRAFPKATHYSAVLLNLNSTQRNGRAAHIARLFAKLAIDIKKIVSLLGKGETVSNDVLSGFKDNSLNLITEVFAMCEKNNLETK